MTPHTPARDDDPLAFPRAVLVAIWLSVPLWAGVLAAVRWWL